MNVRLILRIESDDPDVLPQEETVEVVDGEDAYKLEARVVKAVNKMLIREEPAQPKENRRGRRILSFPEPEEKSDGGTDSSPSPSDT